MTERPRFPPFPPRPAGAPLPLEGIRVIDFSRMLAGPYCAQTLADFGAEVIKIESPVGDDLRVFKPPVLAGEGPFFISANRNKRSIVLDLKNSEGQRVAKELIRKGDVLVENFSNGVMERFGLDYPSIEADNPRLLYCSISGYGRDDPSPVARTGYDAMFQATSGFMSLTGEPDRPPMRTAIPMLDIATAIMSTNAVLAALMARERLGKGQLVAVALFDVAMAMMTFYGTSYLIGGENPTRTGNRAPLSTPSDAYTTSDGLIFLTCNDRLFRRLCVEGLNRPDLADNPNFATIAKRCERQDEITVIFNDIFKTDTTANWVRKLQAIGVPIAPINTVEQAMLSDDVRNRRIVGEVPHPSGEGIPLIRSPFQFGLTPVAEPVAPPILGQHTDEILTELLGYDRRNIEALRTSGAFGRQTA